MIASEPPAKDHPLFKLDNVLWTPHLGAVTLEASERGEWGAAEEVIRVLESKRPKNPVVDADEARLLLPAYEAQNVRGKGLGVRMGIFRSLTACTFPLYVYSLLS